MRVGIVGAGQLARMLLEEASALGVEAVVLANDPSESAASTAGELRLGAATDFEALSSLAEEVDVLTFDHELVDLDQLRRIEEAGHRVAPSPSSLRYASDKAAMRVRLAEAGLPSPAFEIAAPGTAPDLHAFGEQHGWPLVVKAATGGYDGRGVYLAGDLEAAAATVADLHGAGITALIEERVAIRRELAALLCRRPGGELSLWPVVETAQIDGVCREVLVPGGIDRQLAHDAEALARRVAEVVEVVGVMAVELFETDEGLVVNELAMRPHNSGHWTQDGAVTSQFENHLRAVLDLPLGATETTAPHVASVNVFGAEGALDGPAALADALAVAGAHVHLYGKESRPGRKMGHVNVAGDEADEVRRSAWAAAVALGTPVPAEIGGI